MHALLQIALNKLASLRCWRIVCRLLARIHSWLAIRLDARPGFIGWMWRLTHVREWQKSAAQSAGFWLLCTLVIYSLVAQLGHGWQVNIAVSLALDVATYAINRAWIWPRRKVSIAESGSRNVMLWICFALVNGGLAWLLMGRADVGTMQARGLLACYGIAMNPVVFILRDRVVFSELKLKSLMLAGWRVFRKV